MVLLIILICILFVVFNPTIDKLSNGDVVLWYNSNGFRSEYGRKYFYLYKHETH